MWEPHERGLMYCTVGKEIVQNDREGILHRGINDDVGTVVAGYERHVSMRWDKVLGYIVRDVLHAQVEG
jgi:hypothetical protein